ncbi:ATP-binding protein [Mycolicibacterium novocastrense]|uniref:ATP-binding protein n=1 Tax=Mycolicibacterium novocastrense TaxID=59813 RepID=A0AAW5SKM8_MYCNV|nr:ATP-binding protein [Mycolicibacterium novocastrense]MCV7024061.1 ATP-binding protein [Mycolicibacterium novocastrense]GAT09664.1 ATPase AAA central domain-containing protein [Mycolicibacterium novocastrense]
MARADLLLALVRSGAGGDELAFRRAAEALIAEEEGKKHGILASQLADALTRRRPYSGANVTTLARNDDAGKLYYEQEPERRVSDLVLLPAVRSGINELIEEHHRRDLLRSHGVEPRHRLLLVGPAGGGKTTLAEAIATELAVPLLTVRYEGLIGSYLGETASRMEALFAAVRVRPCVLFFDEFDAVAKERGDTHETGEIKRVVSSLLLQVDRLPSHVIVVAATNHAELLDRAVWRRMQLRLELPQPTRSAKIEWLKAWTARTGVELGLTPRTIADRLRDVSFAELEDFARDVQRRLILTGPEPDARRVTQQVLDQWALRVGVKDR